MKSRRKQPLFLRNVPKKRPWLSLWESWLGAAETERVAGQREILKKQQANSYKRNHNITSLEYPG